MLQNSWAWTDCRMGYITCNLFTAEHAPVCVFECACVLACITSCPRSSLQGSGMSTPVVPSLTSWRGTCVSKGLRQIDDCMYHSSIGETHCDVLIVCKRFHGRCLCCKYFAVSTLPWV